MIQHQAPWSRKAPGGLSRLWVCSSMVERSVEARETVVRLHSGPLDLIADGSVVSRATAARRSDKYGPVGFKGNRRLKPVVGG